MNTLVLVSPDTDTARKSGIGYLDLRFPVRARFPIILNRHSLAALFLFLTIQPSSSFLPSFPSSFFLFFMSADILPEKNL